MGRLHRLYFLTVLIGPAIAQITYPNCTAGWEWVSIPHFPCIGPILVSDRIPMNSRTTACPKTPATLPHPWRLHVVPAVSCRTLL